MKHTKKKSISFQGIDTIKMDRILDALGIEYENNHGNLSLYEGKELTSGWKVNVRGNFVNDHTDKGRAKGGPFAFVKSYLNLDSRGVFQRFNQNFG